jgi:hypothetical protein
MEEATSLMASRDNTVWVPGDDGFELIPLRKEPQAGTQLIVSSDLTPQAAQTLRSSGSDLIWVLPAETVEDMGAGKVTLPIAKTEPIIETRSDGASRALVRSASRYVVKSWDTTLLSQPDAAFMKSPIFQAIDGIATRSQEGGALPTLEIVSADASGGISSELLASTVARSTRLLIGLGVKVTDATVIKQIKGVLPDAPPPADAPSKPATPHGDTPATGSNDGTNGTSATPPSSSEAQAPTEAIPDPQSSHSTSSGASPSHARHSSSGGCTSSHAPPSEGVTTFALMLAAAMIRRRRSRTM